MVRADDVMRYNQGYSLLSDWLYKGGIVSVTLDEVRDIAELAKLELTEVEVETYAKQLSAILDYFNHLASVDTTGVDAIASVLPLSSVLRPDVPKPALAPEDAVANAPESQDNQFRVHAVLEE